MAFETKKVYRPVNGDEIKTLISQRVLQALREDAAVNIARAFPLFRYEITVKLTPYHAAAPGVAKPDPDINYTVDGAIFCPLADQTVELVETSPLYGFEADPQDLRRLAEQGTVETARTDTGEVVDVRVKEKPAPIVETATAINQPHSRPAEEETAVGEKPEETYKIEEQRWAVRKPDESFDRALETRDPSLAPGRVSIVGSGFQDHGHKAIRR